MLAIFKRDLSSYFNTLVGFIFLAIMFFITGTYISYYNIEYGAIYMSYAFQAILLILILAVSILTMRMMAEERKSKTDQLIFTAPVSITKIVIGKYLAALAVLFVYVVALCIIPLYLNMFGDMPLLESYVDILAVFLYGAACIGVGMFISSLCESQVISAILTFIVLLASYMMDNFVQMLPKKIEKISVVMEALWMRERFEGLLMGNLDLTCVLYFLSIVFISILLTIQSIQKRRYSVSMKNLSLGTYNIIMTVVVIAIVVVANMAVNILPLRYTNIDVTDNKLYSLSDDTKNMIKSLDKKITLYVTAPEDNSDSTVNETLTRMKDLSDNFEVNYVDLTVTPNFYKNYTDKEEDIQLNYIVVECEGKSKIIKYDDLYVKEVDYSTYSEVVTGYDAEGVIVSAIDYVLGGEQPIVYYLKGHSEVELDTYYTELLNKANMEYKELSLLKTESVPEDASCVIINSPSEDISKEELGKLEKYAKAGGSLIITSALQLENLNKLTSLYGVKITDKFVIEQDASYYTMSNPFYMVPDVCTTEFTTSLEEKFVFVPYAMNMEIDKSALGITKLLESSQKAVAAKVDMQTGKMEGESIPGPFCLGVLSEQEFDKNISRAIIIPSASAFTNDADSIVAGGNQLLFKEMLSATVPVIEGKITVPSKEFASETLVTTDGDATQFRTIFAIFIPVVLLVFGGFIWLSRRKH